MRRELDPVVHADQIDVESRHVGFPRGFGRVVGDGVEDVVAVVDAGVQGTEVEASELGIRGAEGGGLGVPGGDVAADDGCVGAEVFFGWVEVGEDDGPGFGEEVLCQGEADS